MSSRARRSCAEEKALCNLVPEDLCWLVPVREFCTAVKLNSGLNSHLKVTTEHIFPTKEVRLGAQFLEMSQFTAEMKVIY